jgi:hypothetical protein
MSSIKSRWSISTAALACLAVTAMALFFGFSRIEHPPASPTTVWLADDDDDWINQMNQQQEQLDEMEEQQAQQTAQQAEDLAQQEQQIVDQQNAFDESMTAGNN